MDKGNGVAPAAESLDEHMRCRLFLLAVLPALQDLLKVSEAARDCLGKQRFSLCLKTRSGVRVGFRFAGGSVRVSEGSAAAAIELYFHTDNQVIALFEKRKAVPPMPTRGFHKLARLKTFQALAGMLEEYLRPPPARLTDPVFAEAHVRIAFGVALRALCQLGQHEPVTRRMLASGPCGCAVFQLGQKGYPSWISLFPEKLGWGRGVPPMGPDVRVRFFDLRTAVDALQARLDTQAAVGLGQLQVEGLVPLADHIDHLLERVGTYLDGR